MAAAADDAVNPSPPPPPPPSRILVAVLALLHVAARAFFYLFFATAWVLSAIGAAMVVARLAWGEGSAAFVFLLALVEAALRVCCIFFLVLLAALLLCSRFLDDFVLPGSGSESKKSTFEAIMEEATKGLFRYFHVAVLGLAADLAFFLLIFAGVLVMMVSSPVEGSKYQGEMIGSVIVDLGLLAIQAISCFAICPAVLLSVWRKYQEDRKEPSQFC